MFQATDSPGVLPVLPQSPDWALLLTATPQRGSLETLVPVPGSSQGQQHLISQALATNHPQLDLLLLRNILNLGTVLSDPKGTPQCLGQKNRMPCYCWRGNHSPSAGRDPPSLFPQQDSCFHWATCPQQGNLVPDGPLMTEDLSLTPPPALPWGSETQHSSSSFCFYLPTHSFLAPPCGCFASIHPPNVGAPWATLSPCSFPKSSPWKTSPGFSGHLHA